MLGTLGPTRLAERQELLLSPAEVLGPNGQVGASEALRLDEVQLTEGSLCAGTAGKGVRGPRLVVVDVVAVVVLGALLFVGLVKSWDRDGAGGGRWLRPAEESGNACEALGSLLGSGAACGIGW